jgi:hypothetical protein
LIFAEKGFCASAVVPRPISAAFWITAPDSGIPSTGSHAAPVQITSRASSLTHARQPGCGASFVQAPSNQ